MTQLELNSYLKFGYNLNYSNKSYQLDFSKIDKSKYVNTEFEDLVSKGVRILSESFESIYTPGKKYLVPLSGGADSRAIIGLLMKYIPASEISTYTFGTPGTYDFDIGNMLAKKLGTKHFSFDLWKYQYTSSEMLDVSKRFDFQSPLLLHPPMPLLDDKYKEHVILSGANAGAVVGSFVPDNPAISIEEAMGKFVKKASFVKSIKLHNCNNNDFIPLVSVHPISPEQLTFDEQVYFNERSVKHLAPHVLIRGFEYKLPFINNAFMDFMLSVPNQYRKNKILYKHIVERAFPELFKYPSEGSYGLRINANKKLVNLKQKYVKARLKLYKLNPSLFAYKSPMINYIDFEKAFRQKEDLKSIVQSAIFDLKSRNIVDWIDIQKIWDEHQSGSKNYGDALLTLFSLEYHLKNGLDV